MSRPIVYLGPTLPLARARALLGDADYRPPIKRGDLPASCDGTILIVDGEFAQSLSVSPKEILRLLDDGTTVIGAASMGALRAVELAPFGMLGCGWVFESYAAGRIEADDEVAVAYSPEDLTCLTVPLVNVRWWLEGLCHGGELDRATARRLLAAARRIFYADRSEPRLFASWRDLIGAPALDRVLAAYGGRVTDIKAADAESALAMVAAMGNSHQQEDHDGSKQRAEPAARRGAWASVGR